MDNLDEEYWKNIWAEFYKRHTRQLMQKIDNQNEEHWVYWKKRHDALLGFVILENIIIAISAALIMGIIWFS